MTLSKIFPAIALSLAMTTPALAVSGIPGVPSLWPAEGAFDASGMAPEIATKDLVVAPIAPTDEKEDR